MPAVETLKNGADLRISIMSDPVCSKFRGKSPLEYVSNTFIPDGTRRSNSTLKSSFPENGSVIVDNFGLKGDSITL
jgi:hypothetical protein